MAYQSFEDLQVWQGACRLALQIFEVMENSKNYALKDQMTRSSISIPSNIAEGHERGYPKDYTRFLKISKGSCGELRTQLYLASKSNQINVEQGELLIQETKEISAMLFGLIKTIKG